MSPSDIHSATISVSYLIGATGGQGVVSIGIYIGLEKWRARKRGKEEGSMAKELENLKGQREEDRKTINGFKDTLDRISSDVGTLARQIAAFTGVANGVDYRAKGGV